MNVLVVGSGAREHALAWRLRGEGGIGAVLCAPGNPGIGRVAELLPVPVDDLDALAAAARRSRADLTIVGPELPLAVGIAERFAMEGLALLGPTRSAARLETSKAFAKAFMTRHRIPTADYQTCTSAKEARRAVAELGIPVVLKADGLAAGKGVVVATNGQEADAAIDAAMVARRFGAAGDTLVIEEYLAGDEASFFCLCDGVRAFPLGTAQDHKRIFDDDRGPNTGGMGAFAPSPLVSQAIHGRILREIVEPTLEGMRREGSPYRGFLYVGLMLTGNGPKVIEFNVRFGDPEAQVVLPMIQGDFGGALMAAACGRLTANPCSLADRPHVGVVLASGGYPGGFERGKVIHGEREAADLPAVMVFHAGTSVDHGRLVTTGGRVLTVVASGDDYGEAIERAYTAAEMISFDGMHMRRDIGRRALSFERSARRHSSSAP